jgi:uncharacterized damage-inducible protein DinB
MTPEEIRLLYEYNSWANRRTLESSAALTPEQFKKDMGSSFPSIRDTLTHIMDAEWMWLERFQVRAPSTMPNSSRFADLASLRAEWNALEAKLVSFVRGLTQADLERPIEYKTMKFGVYRNPMWQSLQHVVNHGTYHRGQVTTLLRQLGAQPNYLDLMHFYRERWAAAGA